MIDSDFPESHFRLGLAQLESAVAQALYTNSAAFGSRCYLDAINTARGMSASARGCFGSSIVY
jgi:hypothetical protein